MSQPEKRTKERMVYGHTIVFRTEKTIMETTVDTRNISMSGVYVATRQPLEIGTKCSIEIRLQNSDAPPVIVLVEGIVSRVDDKGQGIEFTHLNEESRAGLKLLLQPRDPLNSKLCQN